MEGSYSLEDIEEGDILICIGRDGRHEVHEVINIWEQLEGVGTSFLFTTKICFPKKIVPFDSFWPNSKRILKRIRRCDLEC